jgi:hypothetical protein
MKVQYSRLCHTVSVITHTLLYPILFCIHQLGPQAYSISAVPPYFRESTEGYGLGQRGLYKRESATSSSISTVPDVGD